MVDLILEHFVSFTVTMLLYIETFSLIQQGELLVEKIDIFWAFLG